MARLDFHTRRYETRWAPRCSSSAARKGIRTGDTRRDRVLSIQAEALTCSSEQQDRREAHALEVGKALVESRAPHSGMHHPNNECPTANLARHLREDCRYLFQGSLSHFSVPLIDQEVPVPSSWQWTRSLHFTTQHKKTGKSGRDSLSSSRFVHRKV